MTRSYPAKVHIVTDIEALSLDSHAAIIDIGAAVAYGNFQPEYFRIAIKPSSYAELGESFAISEETIAFHEEKNPGYLEQLEAEGVSIQEAASEFNEWLAGYAANAELHIWSQGKDYDFPILAHFFRFAGITPAYKYRNIHCIRDLIFLNPKSRLGSGQTEAHTALADAVQAKNQLQKIISENNWYQRLFQ